VKETDGPAQEQHQLAPGSVQKERWVFPAARLESGEGLKEAAGRALTSTCGPNMNTWFVGSHPIGHIVKNPQKSLTASENTKVEADESNPADSEGEKTEKTFFMKARIFAGQANVDQESKAYTDYRWLSKEEVKQKVTANYWSRIKDMLVAQ
jgi:large subunit ribosomal protein L46